MRRVISVACIIIMAFMIVITLTVIKFNNIKEQYQNLDPNLDNYSIAEIIFLSFERLKISILDLSDGRNILSKKSIFDSKIEILNNNSLNTKSFFKDEDFYTSINKLIKQSAELDKILNSKGSIDEKRQSALMYMDTMRPTLLDLQESIYRIQINNFSQIKEIISDNSLDAEISSLLAIFLTCTLFILLWRHSARLKKTLKNKNIFISSIYHELASSIQKIQFATDVINDEANKKDIQKYLDIINFHANKITSQTLDVLEYSKIEMGNSFIQTEPFVLNQITTDAIHSFVKRNNNSLKVRISPKNALIRTDKKKVQSIINNLLDNSNKNSQNDIIHLHLRIFSGYLYIEVKDFGNGFDINKIGKFIQPFNQGAERDTKQGLGLGLTIIKSHIDLLKGSFKARSTIGEGTIFFVKIPVQIVQSKEDNQPV